MANRYTDRQLQEIFTKAINKLQREFRLAKENDSIDDFMNDYGIIYEEEAMPINVRQSKILVVGALNGKLKDYQLAAKKLDIKEDNIEFEVDFSKFTNLNLSRLEYSSEYSDIIFGAVPHSMEGRGDSSSMIAKMESEPNKYPRVTRAMANNSLKLSINSFRNALRLTRYFSEMN